MSRTTATRRPPAGKGTATRKRVLAAAAKHFADRGYEKASVRAVCRRAGANVAAVSYHFGSKRGLYLEVLREGMRLTHGEDDTALQALLMDESLTHRQRLEKSIRVFARAMLRPQADWPVRLMLREMAVPTGALATIIEEFCDPRFAVLTEVCRPFLPGADRQAVALSVVSIVGQVCHHMLVRPVVLHQLGVKGYDEALADTIVEHIVRFSVAALEGGAGAGPGHPA